MHTEAPTQTRRARLGRHLRRNVVGYVALLIAVSMTPLPSWAAATIGTADIKNGAVTTKKLAANAVKSPKIKDGTVSKADLAAAARGYTKVIVERASLADLAVDTSTTFNVMCAPGSVAVGGGGGTNPQLLLTGATAGEVRRSHPIVAGTNILGNPDTFAPQDGAVPTGWRTVVHNTAAEARNAFGFAICASK